MENETKIPNKKMFSIARFESAMKMNHHKVHQG